MPVSIVGQLGNVPHNRALRSSISSAAVQPIQTQLEYLLSDLPGSTLQDYRKGQTIYKQDQRSTGIYRVVEGTVKVSRLADARREAIVDIYQLGEFFGESALLGLDPCCEQATALELVRLKAPGTPPA